MSPERQKDDHVVKHSDRTRMGGDKEMFQTTCWTEILSVRAQDEAPDNALVGQLIGRYWKPVYCYLRRKGYDNEKAKDITQGFFQKNVLECGLFQKANRAEGRFRTFLLTALNNYTISIHRKKTAKKRMPAAGIMRLDDVDLSGDAGLVYHGTPEQAFNCSLVSSLLDRVLSDVQAECRTKGHTAHWHLFQERVLQPITDNTKAPSLASICAKHGITDTDKASNKITTVRRCFERILQRHVRQIVDSDAEVDEEIHDLIQILSRSGAGI